MDNNSPLHRLGYQSPHTPQACDYPLEIFREYSAFHQPVEHWLLAITEDHVYTHLQPSFPTQSSPIQSSITPPVTTTRKLECSLCSESFSRRQERDRHELTHIPYFMHCPLPHCAWRGNRAGLFKKHWQQQDHLAYHEQYGHAPERRQFETYDPTVVLDKIKSGAIPLCEGEVEAIVLVQVKGYELQKTEIWMDPWGRSRK